METIERDYAPFGVQFFYIYKSLAHPENDGYVQPFTLQERLMHVQEAKRTLGTRFQWICDGMRNDIKHALGDAPNSEFVIDPEGRVVRKRSWSEPEQLRRDLEELLFPVEFPTQVSDLDLKTAPPPNAAPRGIVERLPRPRNMQSLRTEPEMTDNGQPFYAKLRAEADADLLRTGNGQLYVGFHLDPLYHVHWNNLTKPIRVTFEPASTADESGASSPATTDARVSPATWDGPKLDAPADVDPREFLVDVKVGESKAPLKLKVAYYACNDEQGWCRALTQHYTIHLEADADGGRVQSRGARRPQSRNE